MMKKDEFLEMLADGRGEQTGWEDYEIDEFLQAMEGDGWVVLQG